MLQAGDRLHPVNGIFIEYAAVLAVPLAWKQLDIGVVADGVFGGIEHIGKLFYRVGHKGFSVF